MKEWTTAKTGRLCGRCGGRIAAGQPVLKVTLAGVQAAKWRCVECAGQPPPPVEVDAVEWEVF